MLRDAQSFSASVAVDGVSWRAELVPLTSVRVWRGDVEISGVRWDRQKLLPPYRRAVDRYPAGADAGSARGTPMIREPLFQVPARGLDAQSGLAWSEVFADDLSDDDLAGLDANERALAMEWRVRIAEAERHPNDHEAATLNGEPLPETQDECEREGRCGGVRD